MELALLVARLLLASVFLLAGLAKFADPKGASKALSDFGLPSSVARPLSPLLFLAEVAVAIALVPVASAWYGACAALALLVIFMIGISVALARGGNPDCHCFGQLHSAPIGKSTLVRNGLLGALAAWLVFQGPMRIGPAVAQHFASASEDERKVFIIAAGVVFFLVFRSLRRRTPTPEPENAEIEWDDAEESEAASPKPQLDPELQRILETGAGWPIGTKAPEFTLLDITGQERSLHLLREHGKAICLLFSSPHCEPCRALWPHIGRWTQEHDRGLNIFVISRGTSAQALAKQNHVDGSRVLLQREFELSESYGVTATPAAVLVGPDGLIRSALAVGREDIEKLISSSTLGETSPTATR